MTSQVPLDWTQANVLISWAHYCAMFKTGQTVGPCGAYCILHSQTALGTVTHEWKTRSKICFYQEDQAKDLNVLNMTLLTWCNDMSGLELIYILIMINRKRYL